MGVDDEQEMEEEEEEKEKEKPTNQDPNTNTTNNNNHPHNSLHSVKDRVKRDEWSEGAVSTLLEVYEAKWVLRNRAKLKGHDWEDVARHVSSRANCTKSPKTSTQCKNKVESMKKRYRSESATVDHASSWPLYSRLDLLLRGAGPVLLSSPGTATTVTAAAPSVFPMEPSPPPATTVPAEPLANAQNSHGSNGVDDDDDDHKLAKEEDRIENKSSDEVSSKNPLDTDSSTPALYSKKEYELRCNKRKKKTIDNTRRRNKEYVEIAESLKWLAEAMIRSEEARMETVKEIERMRVEAEAKRGEMDLKRTEIIANTQLEIARIFASVNNNRGVVDSSLRIGRS